MDLLFIKDTIAKNVAEGRGVHDRLSHEDIRTYVTLLDRAWDPTFPTHPHTEECYLRDLNGRAIYTPVRKDGLDRNLGSMNQVDFETYLRMNRDLPINGLTLICTYKAMSREDYLRSLSAEKLQALLKKEALAAENCLKGAERLRNEANAAEARAYMLAKDVEFMEKLLANQVWLESKTKNT